MTTDKSVCQEAQEITTGERAASYGHPFDNFTRTVNLINARFDTKFTPEDFAEIMILCKIARQAQANKRDNLVDVAGYANTHQMVIDERYKRSIK
jgi:hypothetical protein